MGYLMHARQMRLADSYKHVQERRPTAKLSDGEELRSSFHPCTCPCPAGTCCLAGACIIASPMRLIAFSSMPCENLRHPVPFGCTCISYERFYAHAGDAERLQQLEVQLFNCSSTTAMPEGELA